MSQFTDLFISYSVQDNLSFAQKLWERSTAAGLTVWWDKKSLTEGRDFVQQFTEGLQRSHHVIVLISPGAMASVNCLYEIETAAKLGKSIIPIVCQEHPDAALISQMPAIIRLTQWTFLHQQFEEGFEKMVQQVRQNPEVIRLHTELLIKALHWQKNQKNVQWLLTGAERAHAEEWLLGFSNISGTCRVSELQAELICESRKNAENLATDAYICCSAKEDFLRNRTIGELSKRLITTWFTQKEARKGERQAELSRIGIEQADNFLFFISQPSVRDANVLAELRYACELSKRIVPLLIEPVAQTDFPEEIQGLAVLDFTDNQNEADFEQDISDLLAVMRDDAQYYRQHKLYLTQALKWQRQDKNPAFLLRGRSLQNALAWLRTSGEQQRQPPVALHREFVEESAQKADMMANDVFISYSRNDSDFARKLNLQLQLAGKSTWFDQENITSASDFRQEIINGIASSHNFIFILSPKSVNSPYCSDEVEQAARVGKRFVTILQEDVEVSSLHPLLAKVQWIDFKRQDFYTAFNELVQALELDRGHVAVHTRLQQKAMDWEGNDHRPEWLLRSVEITPAKEWLSQAERKMPRPTRLQHVYVERSEHFHRARRRRNLIASVIVAVVTLLAGYTGYLAWRETQQSKQLEEQSLALSNALQRAESNLLASKIALVNCEDPNKALMLARLAYEADTNNENAKIVLLNAYYRVAHSYDYGTGVLENGDTLVYSPDKSYSARIASDRTIRLYDRRGTEIAVLNQDGRRVEKLSFTGPKMLKAQAAGQKLISYNLNVSELNMEKESQEAAVALTVSDQKKLGIREISSKLLSNMGITANKVGQQILGGGRAKPKSEGQQRANEAPASPAATSEAPQQQSQTQTTAKKIFDRVFKPQQQQQTQSAPTESAGDNVSGDFVVQINQGNRVTDQTRVVVAVTPKNEGQELPSEMSLSNSPDFTDTRWIPYRESVRWRLQEGEGEKTVYVRLRNQAGRVFTTLSDQISLDMPPRLYEVILNGGAKQTNSLMLKVQVKGEGAAKMQISDRPDFSDASWQNYTERAVEYQLARAGTPLRTIYVRLRDADGQVSEVLRQTISVQP